MGLADWIETSENESAPVAVAVPAVFAVEVRATGYGCGNCESNNYLRLDDGWRCEHCGMVFDVIGGTKGPRYLTGDQEVLPRKISPRRPPLPRHRRKKSLCTATAGICSP